MDDDDLPTINLTPSETNANSTERDGFSYHEDDQPLGNHDQPPQDDALLDSVAALADADIAQGEEATAEAAVVSSTPGQGHDNPPSDPEGEAASEDELARLESSSSSDEDDYSLTDSEAEATREFSHAGAEYRNHWARLHEKAHDRKKELQRLKEEMRGSRDENARLRARIKTLEEPKERHTEVVRYLINFENSERACILTNQRSSLGHLYSARRVGRKFTGLRAWREMLRLSTQKYIQIFP